MTEHLLDVLAFESNMFSEEDLRSLLDPKFVEKVPKEAVIALGEAITTFGTVLSRIALQFKDSNGEVTSQEVELAFKKYQATKIPKIYNAWIITDNGTCVFAANYSHLRFPDTIFTGMLLGMEILTKEVSGRELEKIIMNDLAITLREVPPLLCAAVSDRNNGDIGPLLGYVGKQFLKMFGAKVSEVAVDINTFRTFDKFLRLFIQDWHFLRPRSEEGAREHLLETDSIRGTVATEIQKENIASVMHELKKMDVFTIEDKTEEKLGSLIDTSIAKLRRPKKGLDPQDLADGSMNNESPE